MARVPNHVVSFAVFGLFVASPPSADAQSASAPAENVIVTASRLPNPRLVGPMTILAAEEIGVRNDASVVGLLSSIPGVHVNSPGRGGSASSVFLRGGEANFTTVLIDGIQVNDPTNTRGGSFDFATLNATDIERIEIVRGPQSAVYGSDALSGVINVITHGGSDSLKATADAELGSASYARGALRVSGPTAGGMGQYSVAISSTEDGGGTRWQDFRGQSVTGKLEAGVGEATRVSVNFRRGTADSRALPDASGGPTLSVIRTLEERDSHDSSAGLALESQLTSAHSLHFNATRFVHETNVSSPGVAPGVISGVPANKSDSEFARAAISVFLASSWSDQFRTAIGLAHQEESGASTGLISFSPQFQLPTSYDLSRNTSSFFGEAAYSANNGFAVVAGLRIDETDTVGRKTTGKISLFRVLRDDRTRLSAGWSRGFKLASLFALGDPLVGNPNLQPETSESKELAVESQWLDGSAGVQLTVFRQSFDHLIDFDFTEFATVNRGRVETDGIELSGRYDIGDTWRLLGHVTDVDINVIGSAVVLNHRPGRRGGFEIRWFLSDLVTGHLDWLHVGGQFDSSIPTGERTLASYDRVDLAVSLRSSDNLLWRIAIDNLFRREFHDAIGFPSLGRRFRFSVRAEFGGQ